jgi:hypothetical protein
MIARSGSDEAALYDDWRRVCRETAALPVVDDADRRADRAAPSLRRRWLFRPPITGRLHADHRRVTGR